MVFRAGANRRLLAPFLFAVASVLTVGRSALAQQGNGTLTGTVTDTSKKTVPDVIVTVSSPSLQEEQITVTDSTGVYRVPALPPGTYAIRFDKDGFFPNEQEGIALRSDVTLRLNAVLATSGSPVEDVVIHLKPNVDVGSSSTSAQPQLGIHAPRPGLAPPAARARPRARSSRSPRSRRARRPTAYGTSISGATSPENTYQVDGLSVSNPGFGIGRHAALERVRQGGQRRQRRLHARVRPLHRRRAQRRHQDRLERVPRRRVQLLSRRARLRGERTRRQAAVGSVSSTTPLSYIGDIGVDIGGPIIKDKLWFYAGFDIATTTATTSTAASTGRPSTTPIDGKTSPAATCAETSSPKARTAIQAHGQADLGDQRRQPRHLAATARRQLGRWRRLQRHQSSPAVRHRPETSVNPRSARHAGTYSVARPPVHSQPARRLAEVDHRVPQQAPARRHDGGLPLPGGLDAAPSDGSQPGSEAGPRRLLPSVDSGRTADGMRGTTHHRLRATSAQLREHALRRAAPTAARSSRTPPAARHPASSDTTSTATTARQHR